MKKIISLLLCMIFLFALFSCDVPQNNNNNKGNDNQTNVDKSDSDQSSSDNRNDQEDETNNVEYLKQTPVYEGMTVSSLTENADNASLQTISYVRNKSAYMRTGAKAKEPNIYDFYADLGEDLLLYIHINNPDSFEILSFTINGDKYSSYMFEDGSNLETIIIKCNVGNESGVKTFTIDAIKYIDKQAIKDVIIHGEKTISIYVSTEEYVPEEPDYKCKHEDATQIKTLEGKKATCTSTGLTDGQYCAACNEILVAQQEIPMVSHSYENDYDNSCNVCGYIRNKDYFKHEYSDYPESQGLEYRLINDGKEYAVDGIGMCKDSVIVVPTTHEGLPVTMIDYYALGDITTIKAVVIPDSVTIIDSYAFTRCTSLEALIIPESVWYFDPTIIDGCPSITYFWVSPNNPNYKSINGNIYSSSGTELIRYAASKEDVIFTVPDGVTNIYTEAFLYADNLVEIILPDTITNISQGAFAGCSSLEYINLPESIYDIGEGAFGDCSSLQNIILPNAITTISDGMFSGCSSLTSITIPEGVTSIGLYAFSDCTSLSYISLPSSLESIGHMAFCECTSLGEIAFPDSVIFIDTSAFVQCEALTNIILPKYLTTMNNNSFSRCSSLESITIPETVASIGREVFFRCY